MSEYIVDFGNSMAMLSRIIESPSAWLCGEIVRCRDCAYYREEYEECMRGLPSGLVVIFDCESHDFCSFGKRKEGGE